MAMNDVWFIGGPLNGVQMAIEELRTPLLYAEFHPERLIDPDAAADSDVTTHRYNLDTRDYDEQLGAPAFYIHEEHQSDFEGLRNEALNRLEGFLTFLASSVVQAIEFEESMMDFEEGQDIHGYSTPCFDSGSGVSAEELVPGIEQALRDWAETKKRIKEEEE